MLPFPFVNFLAATRKPMLIPFNYFSPDDSISWIQSVPSSVDYVTTAMTGTINGINTVFTIPGIFSSVIAVVRNGVVLDPSRAYSVSGSTVTFSTNPAYIPQSGDDLMAIVS
jgi:hypothetical protein